MTPTTPAEKSLRAAIALWLLQGTAATPHHGPRTEQMFAEPLRPRPETPPPTRSGTYKE
jgi:hypothetical protein